MAGLSMGGGETSSVGFAHLDLFSSLGIFSSSGGAQFGTTNAKLLAGSRGTNAKLNVLWMGIGDHDPGFANAKAMSDLLNKSDIKHTFRSIEGGQHTWPVWRVRLSEYVPLLFQNAAGRRGISYFEPRLASRQQRVCLAKCCNLRQSKWQTYLLLRNSLQQL